MESSGGDGSELLVSTETLACDSPIMWPDQNFFGDFDPLHLSTAPPKWLKENLKVEERTIAELSSLSKSQLVERVRMLQNLAYKLGVEEAREMTRGKCLNVFASQQPTRKTKHSNK